MAKINAIGPIVLFHHGFDDTDGKTGFGTGACCGNTRMSGAYNHHIGLIGLLNTFLGNRFRWDSPCGFAHGNHSFYYSMVIIKASDDLGKRQFFRSKNMT